MVSVDRTADPSSVSSPVRWGILGTARTAEKRMLPAMLRSGQRVVAIAGRKEDLLKRFSEKFEISSTYLWDDAEQVLDNRRVEAVYIPLPNSLHAEWTVRSLRAGKHVLCEKPIALDGAEARQILQASATADAHVSENFSYYLCPAYRLLEELAASGELGELRSVAIRHSFVAKPEHGIRYQKSLGGGSFLDLGCYAVDFLHRYLGEELEVLQVWAVPPNEAQRTWGSGPEDLVDARCTVRGKTASGIEVKIDTSFVGPAEQSVEMSIDGGDGIFLPQAFRVESAPSQIFRRTRRDLTLWQVFDAFDANCAKLCEFAEQLRRAGGDDEARDWRWRRNGEVLRMVQERILKQLEKE